MKQVPPHSFVRVEREGSIAVIVIDNPPVNAGSWDIRSGIVTAIGEIAEDDAITAAVLIGFGKTFIAGSDIKEFGKPLRDPQMPAVITSLESCRKPFVAAIAGAALGGGFEVALGCDARVAAKNAVVGLPEVHLGIIPGAGGTQRVPRLVGIAKAIELISSGRHVPADEALQIGLIDAIADGDLRSSAVEFARALFGRKRRVRDLPVPPDLDNAAQAATDKALRGAKRNQATRAVPAIVARAAQTSMDEGLAEERAIFQRLRTSEAAAALRHLFFAERAAGRLENNVKPRGVALAGVIGGGTMGAGIAVCFADAGFPVILVERDKEAIGSALERIRATYERMVNSERITAEEASRRVARVTGTVDYSDLKHVDFVVEAVFEDIDIKRDVFAKLDQFLKPGTILGSNTSYLDLDFLAEQTKRPEDVVGMHFFAPANVMKLVEVVRTKTASTEALATALAVAKKLRKLPVVARVCEGFIGNRIYAAYRRECEILLEEGAYPEEVDAALVAFGFAMGPFAVGDLSGLDIAWRTRKRLAASRDPREKYVPILDRLCEMGRLGVKAGAGWYSYTKGGQGRAADAVVHEVIDQVSKEKGIERRQFAEQTIQSRALCAIVNEAALVLEDGIAERPGDIDLVLVNGYGFPADRGGPLFWAGRQPRDELDRILQDVSNDIGFGFRRGDLDRVLAD